MTRPDPPGGSDEPSARSAEEILPLVYDELRALAHARLRSLPAGQTLQATALVHEAYLRLERRREEGWDGRGHYFFAAARAMRDILIEDARRKGAAKRGGDARRVPLEDVTGLSIRGTGDAPVLDVLAVEEALGPLEALDREGYEVVMLRVYAGLGVEEVAGALGVSPSHVKRKWRFSRAWLRNRMAAAEGTTGGDA